MGFALAFMGALGSSKGKSMKELPSLRTIPVEATAGSRSDRWVTMNLEPQTCRRSLDSDRRASPSRSI